MAVYPKDGLPKWPEELDRHKGRPVAKRRHEARVGRVVFVKDEDHRIYRQQGSRSGYSSGGPIERYFYRPALIVGETRLSWVLDRTVDHYGRWSEKVRKAEGFKLYGLDDVEDAIWDREHRAKICSRIQNSSPYNPGYVGPEKLRQIAELIGYKAG